MRGNSFNIQLTSNNQPLVDNAAIKSYHSVLSLTVKVMVLTLSSFYFGYTLPELSSFSTNNIEIIWGPDAAKTTINAVLIGILPVGGFFGAGLAPLIMKYFSRKRFILFINLLALIVEDILNINNMCVLLVCRAFQGIFVGCYMAITPIYINQLAPKEIVGSFGVFTQLSIIAGIIVSYALGLLLTKIDAAPFVFYRVMVTANSITIMLQSALLLVDYIPESPCSLIRFDQNEKAKQVIAQFTVESQVQKVFRQKCQEVQAQQSELQGETSEQLFSKQEKIIYTFRAFLLGFQLPLMQQLTGINSIITQANNIVANVIPNIAQYVSLIFNGVSFFAAIIGVAILVRFGRKCVTLYGNVMLAICDIVIGIFFIFQEWEASGYIILAFLVIYSFVFGSSIGPIVWLYVPQIIPSNIVPFATMTNWLGASICVIFTPIVIKLNDNNPYPVFFFFGAVTFIFFVMNVILMVQTKGHTKAEIAKLFIKQQ